MKWKVKLLKIIILIVTFVGFVKIFGMFEEGSGRDMTMSLTKASLPEVEFLFNGKNINKSPGYVMEMDIKSLGKSVTPLENGDKVNFRIIGHGNKIKNYGFKVYSSDGKKKIMESSKNNLDKDMKGVIDLGKALRGKREGIIVLSIDAGKDKKKVFYYARIKDVRGERVDEAIEFADKLHSAMIKKSDKNLIEKCMEPNPMKAPGILDHVTIHSSVTQAMYGDYKFEEEKNINTKIFETADNYVAIVKTSNLEGTAPEGDPHKYKCREYYKISTVKDESYLIDYDRKLCQTDKKIVENSISDGLSLGVLQAPVSEKESENKEHIAFLLDHDFYGYNKKENKLVKIFSFRNDENFDERNDNTNHVIRIMDIENDGSVSFAVCGYMNRGVHEGKVGVSLCFYDSGTQTVKEKCYIESRLFPDMMQENLAEFIYYSKNLDTLWMMVEGTFYKIDFKEDNQEILARDRKQSQYKISKDNHYIAYEPKKKSGSLKEICVLNMKTGKTYTKKAKDGTFIVPLGFIDGDFIMGKGKDLDAGKDILGNEIYPLNGLEIMDKNKVKKTYDAGEFFIKDISVKENQIEIYRLYNKDNVYKNVSSDYITNNSKKISGIKLGKSCDFSSMQYTKIIFSTPIKTTKMRELTPQIVKTENHKEVEIKAVMPKNKYIVYDKGEFSSMEDTAGRAIKKADKTLGLVTNCSGYVIWERNNRPLNYMIGEILEGKAGKGETDIECCIRLIAKKEEVDPGNVKEMLKKNSVNDTLEKILGTESYNLSGIKITDTFDIIRRGTPVIVIPSVNEAYLITGYTSDHIIYIDPSGDGELKKMDNDEIEKITADLGQIFVGYRK